MELKDRPISKGISKKDGTLVEGVICYITSNTPIY